MDSNKKQPLLPAYLIVGEDALKRRTVIDRLRARVSAVGNLDFNHDRIDGDHAGPYDVVNACNMLPFDSETRLVEVNHAEKLDKKSSDLIIDYLARPCESTVLALIADKLAKNSRLYKAVAAIGDTAIIDCAPLKHFELIKAVRAMAVGHGFTLTNSASDKLVELVGEDTVRIDVELRKLSLAHKGNDPVNEHEVSMLVAQTAEVKPWEFVDNFAARDIAKCLKTYPHIESSSPYALLSMCTSRIRELLCAKSLIDRGMVSQLAAELSMPPWRVKNHAIWANRFDITELETALSLARDCEKKMKSGTDPESAFIEWVLDVLSK